MSTIAVFLALGGGSLAAVGGHKGSGDGSGQEQGSGSGGNGGGDTGGKGDKGGKGHKDGNGDKGDNGGGSGNDSGSGNVDANGSLNVTTRNGDSVMTDPDSGKVVASATCEKQETVVGGGVNTEPQGDRVRGQSVEGTPVVASSAPDSNGWKATVVNSSGLGGVKVTAYVICAAQ